MTDAALRVTDQADAIMQACANAVASMAACVSAASDCARSPRAHPVLEALLTACESEAPVPCVKLVESGVTLYQVVKKPRRVEIWVSSDGTLQIEEHRGRFGRKWAATTLDRQTRGRYDVALVLAGATLHRGARPQTPVGVRATQRLLRHLERLGARAARRARDAAPTLERETWKSMRLAVALAGTALPPIGSDVTAWWGSLGAAAAVAATP